LAKNDEFIIGQKWKMEMSIVGFYVHTQAFLKLTFTANHNNAIVSKYALVMNNFILIKNK
jgi:hypothetical protein